MLHLAFVLLLACAPKAPVETAPVVVAPPPDPLATMPTIGADTPFSPPSASATTLSNGVVVWTIPSPTLPIVSVELRVPGGAILDPKGKVGTAALGARMLTQGAGRRNAEAFAAEVERLGIDLSSEVTEDHAIIRFGCAKDVLPAALDLVADMVLRPTFATADVTRERDLAISGIEENLDDPNYVSARTAKAWWWGAEHPYGRPVDGTLAGLKKVGPSDLKAWHKAAWIAAGAGIVVSGAVTADEVKPLLEARFGATWEAGRRAPVVVPPAPAHDNAPIYLVDKPDSAQTGFFLVFPGVKVGDAAMPQLQAGTIVLGGTFTSRLNGLLREKRGYTYGVRSAVQPLAQAGVLTIRTRIRTDVTAPAMVDLLGELDSIRKGITAEELVKAQGAWRQDLVEAMETRDGVVATFGGLLAAREPADSLATKLAAMKAITTGEVAPAMSAFDATKGVIVLVGDRAKIEADLTAKVGRKIEVVSVP